MASSTSPSLKALVVFQSNLDKELIRSVHLYETESGVEEIMEREYVFNEVEDYKEMNSPNKVFTAKSFIFSAHYPNFTNGLWVCILAFEIYLISRFDLGTIPDLLNIFRNPKLASIPTLAGDLEAMVQMVQSFAQGESSQSGSQGSMQGPREIPQHAPRFDLNIIPISDSDSDES